MQEDTQLINLIQPEIEFLATKGELKLDNLPTDIASKYNLIRAAVSMSYDSSSYRQILITLNKLKPKVKYEEGTIGSYLFGCLYASVIEGVPVMCTTQCSSSIPGPDGSCCPNSVWSYTKQDGLTKTNNVRTEIAYLYLPSRSNILSSKDVRTLLDDNVRSVIYLYSDIQVQDLTPINLTKKNVTLPDNSHSSNVKMNSYMNRQSRTSNSQQSRTMEPTGQSRMMEPTGQSRMMEPTGQSRMMEPTGQSRMMEPTRMMEPSRMMNDISEDKLTDQSLLLNERREVDVKVEKKQTSWLWIILAVIIVAILIWWFCFRNRKTNVVLQEESCSRSN
jgi:hypothetical protein